MEEVFFLVVYSTLCWILWYKTCVIKAETIQEWNSEICLFSSEERKKKKLAHVRTKLSEGEGRLATMMAYRWSRSQKIGATKCQHSPAWMCWELEANVEGECWRQSCVNYCSQRVEEKWETFTYTCGWHVRTYRYTQVGDIYIHMQTQEQHISLH